MSDIGARKNAARPGLSLSSDLVVQRAARRRRARRVRARRVGRALDAAEIRRRAALRGPREERRAARDARRDVGDVHADRARRTVGRPLERERVVDVAGARVVDREHFEPRRVRARRRRKRGADRARRARLAALLGVGGRERPRGLGRVAARQHAEVELVRVELGRIVADRPEQLDELGADRLPAARRRLAAAGAAARRVALGELGRHAQLRPVVELGRRLAVGDHARAAAEEQRRRDAVLPEAVAILEAQDADALDRRHGSREFKRSGRARASCE